jgi:hypothetical protein
MSIREIHDRKGFAREITVQEGALAHADAGQPTARGYD